MDSAILARSLQALRRGERFDVHELYELTLDSFDVAADALNAWRFRRYHRGGAVLAAASPAGH